MIIITDNGNRLKVRQDQLPAAKEGQLKIWGRKWDKRKQQWSTKNHLHCVQSYIFEEPVKGIVKSVE
jgi:hypothetical protein